MATIEDGRVQLGARVWPQMRKELKMLSVQRGTTMQEEVDRALRAYLDAAQGKTGAVDRRTSL